MRHGRSHLPRAAKDAHVSCRRSCRGGADRAARRLCKRGCAEARAEAEAACGFVAARAVAGAAELPSLPLGRPADLSLLTDGERAVIAAADARALDLRSRPLRVSAPPGTEVTITQVRHRFPFGFALDSRKFAARPPDDFDFFSGIARDHTTLAVVENSAKWNVVEPQPGVRVYDFADQDVNTARQLGFAVKGHTLNWGITPPFSSSGAPQWVFDRFPDPNLSADQQEELRDLLRAHVTGLVTRYRDDISIWDVTNETLQPLGQWFVQRLGPGIVNDLFRWAHEADPDATLVFNEWIVEVFTGFSAPTAADVRDRVLDLLAAGVPVHAIGQQAHFVPAAAFAGIPVDLSQRTRIDDYAVALDTLAEAGLPIHITETNFIAPDEPEARAAQAEGLMSLWWGHPSVQQIIFWGLWNPVAGRDEFDVGLWDDARNLSRHGEAVVSLLNDRWRTRLTATTGPDGRLEVRATHGDYVAQWTANGQVVHARFSVEPGPAPLTVALVGP